MSKRHRYRNNKLNKNPSTITNKMKEILIENNNNWEIKLLSVLLNIDEATVKKELDEMDNLAKNELKKDCLPFNQLKEE